jgi:hypothetical protein
VHLRQLAKKSTYVPYFFPFFLVRFWAFLGKGSSKTRGKKLSTFQKKTPGKLGFKNAIKKKHVIVRVQKFNPGQIKYVRTLAVFCFFFLSPLGTMDALLASREQRSGASGLSHARALNAADVGATEVAVDTSRALSLKLYWYWCCTLLNLGALLRAALQVLRAAETCCYLLLL